MTGAAFLPIHIYDGASGKPVAMILRTGKTPSGKEVRTILKHVIGRIRRHWPKTQIVVRGDSHYGRHEAMEWCENHGIDYVFGFAGNDVLNDLMCETADALCVERALSGREKLRRFRSFATAPRAGDCERSLVARLEATRQRSRRPLHRHLAQGWRQAPLRDALLRTRRSGELHQAAQSPARFRSHLVPRSQGQSVPPDPAHRCLLAHARRAQGGAKAFAAVRAEFATLRLRLIKIAARVVEGAARIRVSLPSACPDAALFRQLAGHFAAADP